MVFQMSTNEFCIRCGIILDLIHKDVQYPTPWVEKLYQRAAEHSKEGGMHSKELSTGITSAKFRALLPRDKEANYLCSNTVITQSTGHLTPS